MKTEPIHPHVKALGKDESGTIRVGGTRVSLDTVVSAFWNGTSPEQIMTQYDVLTLPQIYEALSYYLNNREEADAYLEERRKLGEKNRREAESRGMAPKDLRRRLLERKRKAEQNPATRTTQPE